MNSAFKIDKEGIFRSYGERNGIAQIAVEFHGSRDAVDEGTEGSVVDDDDVLSEILQRHGQAQRAKSGVKERAYRDVQTTVGIGIERFSNIPALGAK